MSKAKINPEFTYKTRDGRRVTDVCFIDVKEDDQYVVCARVEGYYEYFTEQGYYYKGHFHDLDLIKQPVKKSNPVVKPVQKEVMKNASTPEAVQQDEASTQHVHHDMIVAWAKNTCLEMQFKPKSKNEWRDFRHGYHTLDWDTTWDYRIKQEEPKEPKFLTIIGADGKARSYPEPCRVKPEVNSVYYTPVTTNQPSSCVTWLNDHVDTEWLSWGIVHLTKEAAELHAKAMLGID